LNGAGTFHLLLYFFLFPLDHDYNVIHDIAELHHTGLSRDGLVRMQKLPTHVTATLTAKRSFVFDLSSSSARWRQWKWWVMKHVLQQGQRQRQQEQQQQQEHMLVLAIVFSNPKSMHGKVAMVRLEMFILGSTLLPDRRCSLPVTLALFILVLGQNMALKVLRETIEADYSQSSANDDARDGGGDDDGDSTKTTTSSGETAPVTSGWNKPTRIEYNLEQQEQPISYYSKP
jgi:hypothetical protein